MADVKVYLFDYFDRLLKRDRRSTYYATADAIAGEGATIIAESVRIHERVSLGVRALDGLQHVGPCRPPGRRHSLAPVPATE